MYTYILSIYTNKNSSSTCNIPYIISNFREYSLTYENTGKLYHTTFKLHQRSIYLLLAVIKTYTISASVMAPLKG